MIRKIKEAIEENHLLEQGEKIIVAVSGGSDSVALLKVLEMLSEEYNLTLIVAHINHGIREEGADEEQFVREIAAGMGIAFECKIFRHQIAKRRNRKVHRRNEPESEIRFSE